MKVVFFGTPDFALNALSALLGSRHKLLAVVSQPDRAKDRKGRLLPTPVAAEAKKHGLKLFQFNSVKKEGIETLKNLNADIFVTAAYGQLLSQEILDIPRFGVINVHASLLPKYRGSSPVHHAILNGEKITGVTIMQTRLALDSGEIILQAETDILPGETAVALTKRLSNLGADLLLEALNQIENGTAQFLPQNHDEAVFCGKITSLMSKIDWAMPANQICNLIHAVTGSACIGGRHVKITNAEVYLAEDAELTSGGFQAKLKDREGLENTDLKEAKSGEVVKDVGFKGLKSGESKKDVDLKRLKHGEILSDRRLLVRCGSGVLEITALIPAGGKTMTGQDFLLGLKGESVRFE